MENCLFCQIINREVPSEIVYENDKVIAFKDIAPIAPVHILIVPKIHITNSNKITEENVEFIAEVWKAVKEVAKICNIDKKGYRVICNCGEDGGQVIQHIHFHLVGGKRLGVKIAVE